MALTLVFESAGAIVLGLAVCGAIYALIATGAMWRFLRGAPRALAGAPSVSILKPLHGDEPGLAENLDSFCAQTYPGPTQLILGAQDPADPALTVAEQVRRGRPDRDIVVVSDPTPHGSNRKIGNLINMSARAGGEIIVISDSDVRAPPQALERIVAALQAPGVGLVYCLYRGAPTASVWSRLAALDINSRFAPSVVVGQALGAHPVLGPTMALRADLLAGIGGFQRLADLLADDFELGRAVREAGGAIACPVLLIDHVFPETSLGEVWTHELRWARTVRLVQPAGYLGSVIIHFLPLALIGAALTGFSGWSLAVLAALAAFRLTQAVTLVRMMEADGGGLWLLGVRDLLSFGVFVAALVGRRIEWRGNRLHFDRKGAMARR